MTFAFGAMCFGHAAQAQSTASFCEGVSGGLAPLCHAQQTLCVPYLDDPTSLSPDDLSPVPRTFRPYFESTLSSHVIGYRETQWPNVMVVYMFDEPACELLTYGVDYAELLPAWNQWRAGPGAGFVSTTDFEPTSKVSLDRAYAATFLAAPRTDGRVTEITFNWNLSFEGLTRLRISYQPLRDHTRDMLLEAVE